VEKPKAEPAPLSKEQARLISDALLGAIGSALGRLTGAQIVPPDKQTEPERRLGTTKLEGRPIDENGAIDLKVVGGDFEAFYQRIKRRILDECRVDPVLLHILTTAAPELKIDIEPRVIELNEGSLRGRVCILIGRGFFDSPRSNGETIRELKRIGTEPASNRMSEAFASLVVDGALTREGDGFQKAPGVKVSENVLSVR
jgi:hypothetical protein